MTGLREGAQSTTLQPGASQVITVTYQPTKVTTTDASSVQVYYTDGTAMGTTTVTLTGASVAGKGVATASATTVSFGHVRLGQAASKSVTIGDTGNLPLTVTRFTAPGMPFGTPVPIPAGLTIAPGDEVSLPMTYTPQSGGTATGSYQITTSDGHNKPGTLTVKVGGTAATAAAHTVSVPSPGGGWALNGSAAMKGTALDLTAAAKNQAGSAVYYQPLSSNGLKVSFTAQASDGTGGDGMTFSLLAAPGSSTALGGRGALLGFGGLHGIAVVLGTRKDPGFPSANFVGIATGTSHGRLVLAATATSVPNLRKGTHVIGVTVAGKTVTVTVNGKKYLSKSVAVPPTVLAAFTAGTSNADDVHAISKVSVVNGLGSVPPPGGGWSYNGSALMSGSDTDLTELAADQRGTVIYPRAVATSSLTAQFDVQIGGGSGANGMTFALLSPGTSPAAVGTFGLGLGLQKLTGAAVVLSTYPETGVLSDNFVALATAAASGLTFTSSRVPVGQLRDGTHLVTVTLSKGTITVYVDGGLVLTGHVSLAPTALLAFTGGTGHETDMHVVRDAALTASGW